MTHYCTDCNEPCGLLEETFSYAGTHCNHGVPGTHRTGHYLSECCCAEYTDEDPLASQKEAAQARLEMFERWEHYQSTNLHRFVAGRGWTVAQAVAAHIEYMLQQPVECRESITYPEVF